MQQLEELEKKRQEMIRNVLDKSLEEERLLVQKSVMGKTEAYIGNANLRTVADNVKLFTELPLFTEKLNEKGQFVIDEGNVAELEQRAPNHSRQRELTYYLLRQPFRMFPPLVAAVSENWVNNPNAPEWDENKRAKKTSMPIDCLDSKGKICLINIKDGVAIHVLDGSHRLLGIRGVHELWKDGRLTLKQANGTPKKEAETKMDLMDRLNFTQADLDRLIDEEQIGIMFVPSVIKGENREEARRRVRSIFVHINKTAQTPTSGEQLLLDEDDGYSIISREIGLKHPLFKKTDFGDRINWKSKSIPKRSKWLTPGATIKDISRLVLGVNAPFSKWAEGTKKNEIPLRPEEDEIDLGVAILMDFFDRLQQLPTFKALKGGVDIEDLRAFPNKKANPDAKASLLMRPIGQEMIADAIGKLCFYTSADSDTPLMEVNEAFEKLEKLDAKGFFNNIHELKSPWLGIAVDPSSKKMVMNNVPLGSQLIRYMLGGIADMEEQNKLLNSFRQKRITSMDDDGNITAVDLKGNTVDDLSEISLPTPL
ncbi:DGQHR domain-containing protein [Priestia megaterium]|uniref:DGQHR domain-containing protein n=1 Tax=Priestia megaterium TaxID=1404 RepID=UPI00300B33AB